MSNVIYLYLKIHNKTGLKYFGMTKQDPYNYMGSGKRWQNHLSKHGNDVTTKIVYESTDKKKIKEIGIRYSKKWNIVESNDFANLKIEEGDGGFDHINDGSKEHIERCKKASSMVKNRGKGKQFTSQTAGKMFLGKKHSKETKKKISEKNKINQSGTNNSQYGTRWIYSLTEKRCKKISKNDPLPNDWFEGRKMVFVDTNAKA